MRWRDPAERLLEKIEVSPEGCWMWTGAMYPTGYGAFNYKGAARRAHRVSYELFVGPIPTGLQLDHLCRTPRCVNPDHLEAVTARVNTLRSNSPSAINARKTECDYGHALTPENIFVRRSGKRHCRICARRHRTDSRRRAKT